MGDGWIDISVPLKLKSGMVYWPGDPEVRIERVLVVALPPGADRGCAVRPRYRSSAYPRCEGHRRAPLHVARSHSSRPAELCTGERRGIIAPTSATSYRTSFIVDSLLRPLARSANLRCDRRWRVA